MADLPTNRTTANTPAEHVADHNTLHADHNLLEGGSNGQVLTRVAGAAAWATPSGTYVGARVYNTANISCATSGTDQLLTFNTERYDTDTIHDTSSNTSRLTAKTAGKYHISATVTFAANATGARGLLLRVNGATAIALVRVPAVAGGTDVTALTIDTDYDLALNDYVEVLAYQTSTAALNVLAGSNYSPEFMMTKVG